MSFVLIFGGFAAILNDRNGWKAVIKNLALGSNRTPLYPREKLLILLYSLAAVAALIVYAIGARLGAAKTAVIALLVFLIPSVGVTAMVFMIGDRAAPGDVTVLTDDEVVAYAAKVAQASFRQKMGGRQILGLHNGVRVVAEFPCSDDCPANTLGIVHYDVEPGDACKRAGGVERLEWVPAAIAVTQERYYVPKVLADRDIQTDPFK